MAGEKLRVLIVGATGHLGRHLVKASLALGHATFVLFRPAAVSADVAKCQLLTQFKTEGVRLLQGTLDDRESLVAALKQVEVVVSAIAGTEVLQQLKLVEAIKEAGTITRFLPSDFGMDVDRTHHALSPGDEIFKHKRVVRRAIEEAAIPHTFVVANCLAGFFLSGLAQLGVFMPPMDHATIYGEGDKKCVWVAEEDVAAYAMLAADDPRTLNKVLHLRPPANVLSQMEVVRTWERLIGRELKKTFLPEQEWLAELEDPGVAPFLRAAMAHFYDIYYRGGCDFEVEGPHDVDSSELYPDYKYVTAEDYLKRFVWE